MNIKKYLNLHYSGFAVAHVKILSSTDLQFLNALVKTILFILS